ncbi:hypothetical protein Nepgr_032537 [Nepenthes gracilis]|uniref:Uncharacterized protein n=1 Tax=Nepenthes gracilis TaxID=150966 RepID=A0AAD3TK94_NEPGR|nr:hypothetical protein Nepgr_032537 [Nepenthes gracilis]
MISPQVVVVVATAMAAISGTVILFALKFQKSPPQQRPQPSHQSQVNPIPRPCISSESSGKKKTKTKTKRVRFAEDVVDKTGGNEFFRKRQRQPQRLSGGNPSSKLTKTVKVNGIPPNRTALYNSILRDRVVCRVVTVKQELW